MTENLPKTLTCPSCGATLDFDGRSTIVQCKFCKTNVLMPGVQTQAAAPADLAEIRRLAESGNLIEAIRRYRELFDVGLKEAKEAVESLAAGRVVEARVTVSGPLTAEETGRILEEVQDLLRDGNKLEAIRVYRAASDVSLARAKEIVERVEAALTGIPVPPAVEILGEPSSAPAQRKASWLGCSIVAFTLLIVGGVLAAVLFSAGGPFVPFLVANGPAVLIPSESGASDVAAAFYNVTDETYEVGLVEADTGKLRWRSDPLPGDGYVDGLAQAGGLVYAASGADLLAFRADDGSLAWQAQMPDELNYSDSSLLVTGGRVLTANLDQSVQAYDALTGQQVWSRRLAGYDRTLRLIDNSLVLFDYVGDDYTYSLVFLDPADGSQQRLLTPTCQYNEYSQATLDPDSGFIYDEAENSVYLVYDSSPGCIQRLDLASGQAIWQTLDDGWYSSSPNGLLAESRLYFTNGSELLAVEEAGGALDTLLADEDYEFVPLAVSGETLIVRLRRTRGSERFELRGLDAASGEMLWQMDLGDAAPIDPPDELVGLVDEGEPGWTWRLLAGQLVLIHFQAAPNQLVIQTLDPADGTLVSEMTVALKGISGDFYSAPEVIGWEGDLVFINIDAKIYCVNVTTGEVVFHFQ
ncbi:MAG: PQQ-binding-like beta-propeller repeat protein [Chloroflexi bacterium]|nr:PQQ-binding-like beta-propeller repeat protein [Chloroflexota bacterium]